MQHMVPDIAKIAPRLELGRDGLWVAHDRIAVSYPRDGNAICFGIEESSFWFRHRNRCIIECLRNFQPGGFILDIGGGNGFVSKSITEAGFASVVLEPGIEGAVNARRRGLSWVVRATLDSAGFLPRCIPAAGLFDVLEHVEDDVGFLCKLGELLMGSGRLYLTVPAYQALFSSDDAFAGHFRRYTLSSVRRVLERAGYVVEYATYFFFWLPLPILLFRTLPSRLAYKGGEPAVPAEIEHSPPALLARAVDLLLKPELALIRNARLIPCGGSCLVVARLSQSGDGISAIGSD